MREVVIIEAVRTPIGRRNGSLSAMHAIDLLGTAQRALFERTSVDPADVGQVVGGCVDQVGMQAMNVTRSAWLASGLPLSVAATTVDSQCGSSQQATNIAYAMVAGGVVDVAVGCGVEVMSRVPMAANVPKDPAVGKPINRRYREHYEFTTQFQAAELLATQWGLSREDADAFGKLSQDRAAAAWEAGRFASQIVPVDVPEVDSEGSPTGATRRVTRDEGMRATTLEGLAGLKPNLAGGIHSAGTSSQIADGASAVLVMTSEEARRRGLHPKATIVETCLVGCDPILMLEGPVPATQKLLGKHNLSVDEIDLVEINEAFASVVLAWERELKPESDRVNPNGGAIALGHPLGATGSMLLTKAVHELQRIDGQYAIVTMCCGGGLGTGTLLRRA